MHRAPGFVERGGRTASAAGAKLAMLGGSGEHGEASSLIRGEKGGTRPCARPPPLDPRLKIYDYVDGLHRSLVRILGGGGAAGVFWR